MIFHDVVPRSDLRQEVHSPDTWPWARDENRNLCQYTWKQMRHTHICIYNIHAVYHVWSMNVIMQHMNLIWIYIYKHMYKTHTYIYMHAYTETCGFHDFQQTRITVMVDISRQPESLPRSSCQETPSANTRTTRIVPRWRQWSCFFRRKHGLPTVY